MALVRKMKKGDAVRIDGVGLIKIEKLAADYVRVYFDIPKPINLIWIKAAPEKESEIGWHI